MEVDIGRYHLRISSWAFTKNYQSAPMAVQKITIRHTLTPEATSFLIIVLTFSNFREVIGIKLMIVDNYTSLSIIFLMTTRTLIHSTFYSEYY